MKIARWYYQSDVNILRLAAASTKVLNSGVFCAQKTSSQARGAGKLSALSQLLKPFAVWRLQEFTRNQKGGASGGRKELSAHPMEL